MSFRMSSASSGMGVAEHCRTTFLELQRKKVFRYVIFKIDEKKKEVVVEKTGGPAESYADFTASLPESDCRYAVYDFDYVTTENCQKSKIFFIAWSPSVSRIRSKMLYATSKDRFRRELDGIHYELQATDPTEMDLEAARILANLLVVGSGILARSLVQAYRQALINASKSGVTQETIQNTIRRANKVMQEQEARQILGVSEGSSWDEIVKKYEVLFEKNAASGSFYLQSKVHRAKECLDAIRERKSQSVV